MPAAGDLLLEVQFRPHERLRPRGRDIHLTLPLAALVADLLEERDELLARLPDDRG